MVILALGKVRSRREPNMGCGGLTDLGEVLLCQKKPARELYNGQAHCHNETDMLTRSFWMRHSHSAQAQSAAFAGWLAPRESDCSLICSKVSSDWLPSYIKPTQPVLKIFKMTGYFPDSPPIFTFVTYCHVPLVCCGWHEASSMLRACTIQSTGWATVSSDSCHQHSK